MERYTTFEYGENRTKPSWTYKIITIIISLGISLVVTKCAIGSITIKRESQKETNVKFIKQVQDDSIKRGRRNFNRQ